GPAADRPADALRPRGGRRASAYGAITRAGRVRTIGSPRAGGIRGKPSIRRGTHPRRTAIDRERDAVPRIGTEVNAPGGSSVLLRGPRVPAPSKEAFRMPRTTAHRTALAAALVTPL